jgi:hypothetical protein
MHGTTVWAQAGGVTICWRRDQAQATWRDHFVFVFMFLSVLVFFDITPTSVDFVNVLF